MTLRAADDRHHKTIEEGSIPLLAAIAGGVDHLPTAESEHRLTIDRTDVDDREWCVCGVDVQRRSVGLPCLTCVACGRRILRPADVRQCEPMPSVGVDSL